MRGIQKGRPHEMWIGFAKTEKMRTSREEGFIDKRGLLQNIWLLGIISWILQKKSKNNVWYNSILANEEINSGLIDLLPLQ